MLQQGKTEMAISPPRFLVGMVSVKVSDDVYVNTDCMHQGISAVPVPPLTPRLPVLS
jgi:hypothetical protein